MSKSNTDKKERKDTIAVAMLSEYENKLFRHIAYAKGYLIRDLVHEAIDFFLEFRKSYKKDDSKFVDQGIYHTHGKKDHHIKFCVALKKEYIDKIKFLAEEDDRELRVIVRSVIIEYLNFLNESEELEHYKSGLKNIKDLKEKNNNKI